MFPEALVHVFATFCIFFFGVGSLIKGNERDGLIICGIFFLYMVFAFNYVNKLVMLSAPFFYLGMFMWALMGFGILIYAFIKAENKKTTM